MCTRKHTNFEEIVGRLTTFELSNFENYRPENLESTFNAKLKLKDTEKVKSKNKNRKYKYVLNDISIDEEDVEQLEALLARRFHRGKGKFKGKIPIICFNYNEVGHIDARCPKKKIYKGGDNFKGKRNEDNKNYKDKGKKCYIAKEDDSDEHDDEVLYIAMKSLMKIRQMHL